MSIGSPVARALDVPRAVRREERIKLREHLCRVQTTVERHPSTRSDCA